MIAGEGEDWEALLWDVLFWYLRRPLEDGLSHFDLLYRSNPMIFSSEASMVTVPAPTEDGRG